MLHAGSLMPGTTGESREMRVPIEISIKFGKLQTVGKGQCETVDFRAADHKKLFRINHKMKRILQ